VDSQNPNSISVSELPPTLANAASLKQPAKQMDTIAKSMTEALATHWPEYLMEAAGLGVFMISACVFSVVLFHPSSTVAQSVRSEAGRRVLMGIAMGSTAIAIIFSPFGKRSGAHINPAVTLTFFRLGKVKPADAAFYTLFQFAGAVMGVLIAARLMGESLAHQSVKYAVTVPGPAGKLPAFVAELAISFVMMLVILAISNTKQLGRYTGLFAGVLVATYISLESPVSGMSMNPARTFGSDSVAQMWTALWIYFTAPPLGMLLAAEVYTRVRAGRGVACAKLHHYNKQRCIFRCNFEA
jgi:aquaporin Z